MLTLCWPRVLSENLNLTLSFFFLSKMPSVVANKQNKSKILLLNCLLERFVFSFLLLVAAALVKIIKLKEEEEENI